MDSDVESGEQLQDEVETPRECRRRPAGLLTIYDGCINGYIMLYTIIFLGLRPRSLHSAHSSALRRALGQQD